MLPTPCPAGTFAAFYGAASSSRSVPRLLTPCTRALSIVCSCSPCPPGRYCLSGAASKDGSGSCPQGTYSNGGATSPSTCQPCECVNSRPSACVFWRELLPLTPHSSLSASLLSTIKECQEAAGTSLLPLIMGFSASGMAIVGECSLAHLALRLKQNNANPLPSTVFYFVYRRVRKRRKASASVAADPSPAPDPYQPYQAQPSWHLHTSAGYSAPAFPGTVFAKHPPVFSDSPRQAGIQRGFSDPGVARGLYRAPAVPGSVAHFYEGTAPPLFVTPPSSARPSSKAAAPIPAASDSAKAPSKRSNLKPTSRHK